jgi:hypothetical protein
VMLKRDVEAVALRAKSFVANMIVISFFNSFPNKVSCLSEDQEAIFLLS